MKEGLKDMEHREFPGGLGVRIQCLHHCCLGLIPALGTEIPHQTAACCVLKKKKKKTWRLEQGLTYVYSRVLGGKTRANRRKAILKKINGQEFF